MRTIAVLCLMMFVSCAAPEEAPRPDEGLYLGQAPPGKTAEIFAPGIVSTDNAEGCSGFLKQGKVFVWSTMEPRSDWRYKPTYWLELRNGRWTKPELIPFNDLSPYNFTVAPDDKSLFFTSIRSPEEQGSLLDQANIWVAVKTDTGWSEPLMLGPSINTVKYYENYPSVASNRTVYYMSRREEGVGKTDIWRSRWEYGIFQEAENLGPVINTEENDQDPFIAPDESYLIVCLKKESGFGDYDLYVSFATRDGDWTPPLNMGEEINSPGAEFRPYVTPDQRFLFFTSHRKDGKNGDIYWVDASVIQELKDGAVPD